MSHSPGETDLADIESETRRFPNTDKYPNPCTDCATLYEGSARAPRDGYFGSTDEKLLESSSRNNGFYPANRFQSFGFRCARTP